ncbi:MAG: glycosyltransferase family 4 protein [Methanobrevibacter sp.]|jgi:glycosyltransferase involved in cell wall biosynthesis|nr:glycosyltransferase family 4 protein [Candidatus Methanovirga meridionalis]
MNICLITTEFNSNDGGLGNYAKMLADALEHYNWINLKKVSYDNSRFKINNQLKTAFYTYIEMPSLLVEADVYHSITPSLSKRLDKNKTVVTIQDLIPLEQKIYDSSLMSRMFKLSFQIAMKSALKCREIIVTSDDLAKSLTEHYSIDSDNISVVRACISNGFFPTSKNDETYTIGTISQLIYRKRIDILIRSFLKADIKNSRLLIGGKGHELENLKKIANNDDRIVFLGFIPDEKMNDFYNSLDVFVFPTLVEGYGLPMVEAMACGKPVITLEDSQIPHDIKNKTHISSINTLANDLKNRDFDCDIKSNLEFAKEHSPEKMAKEIIEVYKSIL